MDPCPDGATAGKTCLTSPVDATGPADANLPVDASDAVDATAPPPTSLLRGLIGHWHLDDGAGSASALDSSGNGNHASLVDLDPSSAWTAQGDLGGALETRAQGYASVPNLSKLDGIVTQVSVAAWVYLDGPITDYGTAASKQVGSTVEQYYHLALNVQGRASLFISTQLPAARTVQPLAGEAVAPQTWTHIAGTYDGGAARLYVNGRLEASLNIAGSFARDANPFLLGANGNNRTVTERFPGRIDEIVLYDRALDAGEVARLASGAVF